MSDIYAFNIVLEVKTRTIVVMTKKCHPDWTIEQIRELLKNTVDYAIKKEPPKRNPKKDRAESLC